MRMTIKDFCTLLVATMKINGISNFDINRISENLGKYFDNFDSKILFVNLSLGKDNEIIGMKEYLWSMLFSGYGYFVPEGTKWEIIIDNKTANLIIERYSIEYQQAMSFLVNEYYQNIKEKVLKK